MYHHYLNAVSGNFIRLLFILCSFIVISCEEDEEPEEEECNYSTYNPNNADYSCESGYVAVGNITCCPSNAPYHCPSLGKCYTSCDAASDAGCYSITLATTDGGGGGGGNCDGGYQGPTGDIQSDAFCQAAWNYRCYGQDAEADANCQIYKQMQADNPGMEDCPYCN